MEHVSNLYGKFQCPCCMYFTLCKHANNTFQICPVCYWEDDGVQLNQPDYTGGANSVSLLSAQENFLKIGVSDPVFQSLVRRPKKDEV